jgi:hypothetical protein
VTGPPERCPKRRDDRQPGTAPDGSCQLGRRVHAVAQATHQGARHGHEGSGRREQERRHSLGEVFRHLEQAAVFEQAHQRSRRALMPERGPDEKPVAEESLRGGSKRLVARRTQRLRTPPTAGETNHPVTVSRGYDASSGV